jgi:hypothetical protein
MKRTLLYVLLLLHFNVSFSQQIDNPSFDSVYIGGIDRVFEWITSDAWPVVSNDTVHPLNPSDHYVSTGLQYHETYLTAQILYSNAFDGPYALSLSSDTGRVDIFGNPFRGFVVNGNHFYTDSSGYLDLPKCGTPFTHRPVKLIGHYTLEEHSPSLHNYPEAVVLLKKWNSGALQSDTIGLGVATMTLFGTSAWRAFEVPINYTSNQVPDSVVVAFFAPPLGPNAVFGLDSLGFVYPGPVGITEEKTNSEPGFYYDIPGNKIVLARIEDIRSARIFSGTGAGLNLPFRDGIVDLSPLANGVYLLSIQYENGTSKSYKFIR